MQKIKIKLLKKIICFFILVLSIPAFALLKDMGNYTAQIERSYHYILQNIFYPNVNAGAVIASPSQSNPNYFHHWVRDAGLTMSTLISAYDESIDPITKKNLFALIWQWIDFESRLQVTDNPSHSLGEPFFNVDGSPYNNPWGRPQNDGPAIRAIAMTSFAQILIKENLTKLLPKLYKNEIPATSPIKKDLEYVAHHWRDISFDLWEEVSGQHFFTLMAQRKALLQGAGLASYLGDGGASNFYLVQARAIENVLQNHLNRDLKLIEPTLNSSYRLNPKISHLDSAVILAVLYFYNNDGFFNVNNSWVVSTAQKLEGAFKKIYNINKNNKYGTAIGRYPEDVYSGNDFSGGNPWFITTNAFAELYCKQARIKNIYPREGLAYLDRSLLHVGNDGHMSEQMNRNNGYMQGARDLTWSYSSYIRAAKACLNKRGI